jgi:hypothetical protein
MTKQGYNCSNYTSGRKVTVQVKSLPNLVVVITCCIRKHSVSQTKHFQFYKSSNGSSSFGFVTLKTREECRLMLLLHWLGIDLGMSILVHSVAIK